MTQLLERAISEAKRLPEALGWRAVCVRSGDTAITELLFAFVAAHPEAFGPVAQ